MVIPLNVSGAFHSPLMSPAREALADKLDSIQISDINTHFIQMLMQNQLQKVKK